MVSISMRSAPAFSPTRMISANTPTASSKSRVPIGFKSFPVEPMSKATYAFFPLSATAFFAFATPAVTIFSKSSPYLKRLAPKVFANMMSAPAAKYALCICMIGSGFFRFHVSGSSPACNPCS